MYINAYMHDINQYPFLYVKHAFVMAISNLNCLDSNQPLIFFYFGNFPLVTVTKAFSYENRL